MSWCQLNGQSVVVHGGLTGVCDGNRSTRKDVIIFLERMTAIEEIDSIANNRLIEPGCVPVPIDWRETVALS
jgi:FAD/FMN-containing dehydrogenase